MGERVGEHGCIPKETLLAVWLWYANQMVRGVDVSIGCSGSTFERKDGVILQTKIADLQSLSLLAACLSVASG